MKQKSILLKSIENSKNANNTEPIAAIKAVENVQAPRVGLLGNFIIGVAASSRGLGCTHTCIALANYIKKNNSKVAVVEKSTRKHFIELYNEEYKDGLLENSFSINGVDYYPYNSHSIFEILNAGYDYIILDLSVIRYKDEKGKAIITEQYTEMQRANKQILVGGIKDWQINDLGFSLGGESSHNFELYITFCDKDKFSDFRNMIDRKAYFAPFCPDPFNEYEIQNNVFSEMLKDVMITNKGKSSNSNRKGLSKILRR